MINLPRLDDGGILEEDVDVDSSPRADAGEAEAAAVAGPEGGVSLEFEEDVATDGGAPIRGDLEEADVVCLTCPAIADRRLELPGGRIVDPSTVPFTDAPAGVSYVYECRRCGEVIGRDR